jgi:hypothetical protein
MPEHVPPFHGPVEGATVYPSAFPIPRKTGRVPTDPQVANDLLGSVRESLAIWRYDFIGNAYFSGFDAAYSGSTGRVIEIGPGVGQVRHADGFHVTRINGAVPGARLDLEALPSNNASWILYFDEVPSLQFELADAFTEDLGLPLYVVHWFNPNLIVRDLRLRPGARRVSYGYEYNQYGRFTDAQRKEERSIYGDPGSWWFVVGGQGSLPDVGPVWVPPGYGVHVTADVELSYLGVAWTMPARYVPEAPAQVAMPYMDNVIDSDTGLTMVAPRLVSWWIGTRTGWPGTGDRAPFRGAYGHAHGEWVWLPPNDNRLVDLHGIIVTFNATTQDPGMHWDTPMFREACLSLRMIPLSYTLLD